MNKLRIKRCPFCKGKAIIKKGKVFPYDAYKVMCVNCKIATQFEIVGAGYHKGNDIYTLTKEQAIKIVVALWNNRPSLKFKKQ